jgi:hypothetical protein
MGAKVATFEQCYNAEKRRRLLNTAKNFSRELKVEDRGEAYYDMTSNPQQELCDKYWDMVKMAILTEI